MLWPFLLHSLHDLLKDSVEECCADGLALLHAPADPEGPARFVCDYLSCQVTIKLRHYVGSTWERSIAAESILTGSYLTLDT